MIYNDIYDRRFHTTWVTKDGVLIIGGDYSDNTTEMATWQGTTEEKFTLKQQPVRMS